MRRVERVGEILRLERRHVDARERSAVDDRLDLLGSLAQLREHFRDRIGNRQRHERRIDPAQAAVVVEIGRPRNSRASRGNNIASLCHNLTLAPGQEKEVIYILGVTDCPEAIAETVAHFARARNTPDAFAALRAGWDKYLASHTVDTPDREMNVMLNVWNPIQCRTTLYWSRFVSAYETGLGRGMGTRDSAQDVLATVQSAPARARDRPAPGGGLYVGTSPDGKIYKLDAKGASTTFFDPKDKYIWALAVDGSGNVFAATGDKGVIYRIAPDGKGDAFYKTKATHVVSLAFDRAGNLLAGTVVSGTLDGGTAIPGFTVKVADIFARMFPTTPTTTNGTP